MFELDYMASVEHDVRQRVILPQAERRERMMRELAEMKAHDRGTWRAGRVRRWLGGSLMGAGGLLRGLGARIAARPADTRPFST
jgi:hypothetical protein